MESYFYNSKDSKHWWKPLIMEVEKLFVLAVPAAFFELLVWVFTLSWAGMWNFFFWSEFEAAWWVHRHTVNSSFVGWRRSSALDWFQETWMAEMGKTSDHPSSCLLKTVPGGEFWGSSQEKRCISRRGFLPLPGIILGAVFHGPTQ